MRFALAGNPNSGKTTLFNSLTGSTAHVGNWPGVTVDKREGSYKSKQSGEKHYIIDLPGIYSLSPYTPEEVISRNYILEEKPDCIIDIVDATNLERNLYLTTQLLEMDVPIVVALNMSDLLEKNGDKIDVKELSKKLGVPVVEVSALKEKNLNELMETAIKEGATSRKGTTVLQNSALKHLIQDCEIAFKGKGVVDPLFHAIKLVENDEIETKNHPDLVEIVNDFKATFKDDVFGDDFEALVADSRYKYITENYAPTLTRLQKAGQSKRTTLSDKIDKVLTNRWAGIPIFLVILFVIFHLIFTEDFLYLNAMGVDIGGGWTIWEGTAWEGAIVSEGALMGPGYIITNLFVGCLDWFNDLVQTGLEAAGAEEWAVMFVHDGIFGGLFAVLGFLPQILLLFLALSILEDTGYMARVAFILDRLFRKFGISGRAFLPMIMGFGCSIPAMINTRTLADDKERTATIRVIPFLSCGAKLPILTAVAGGLTAYLGAGNPDLITFGMYVLGMVVALIALILMRNTTMRGEVPPFIMELPSYHLPQPRALFIHIWDKTKHFVKKAFTIILLSTILIWFLQHITWQWQFLPEDENMGQSILASIGQFIQPIFTPLGFGSQLGSAGYIFAIAAITGLIAKENCIATISVLVIGVLHATGIEPEGDGVEAMELLIKTTGLTTAGAISFIAFNMLTVPCFAAVATAKGELPEGTLWRTIVFWLVTSYVAGTLIYCIGEWWWTIFIFAAVIALIVCGVIYWNKYKTLKTSKLEG